MEYDVWKYHAIDAYKPVSEDEEWSVCPKCLVKPRTWVFDNGNYAKCLCSEKYENAQVEAISICEHYRQESNWIGYDHDLLRKNRNKYCENIQNTI